jgi:hypothetical protein
MITAVIASPSVRGAVYSSLKSARATFPRTVTAMPNYEETLR